MVREEFVEAVEGLVVEAAEDVGEPGARVDADELAGAGEAAEDGGGVAAGDAAEESPVVTADGDAEQRALGGVVVDG